MCPCTALRSRSSSWTTLHFIHVWVPCNSSYDEEWFTPRMRRVPTGVLLWKFNARALHDGRQWYSDWRALAVALGVSCIRTNMYPLQLLDLDCLSAELMRRGTVVDQNILSWCRTFTGIPGHIARTETNFYGLDTLPLIAISAYMPLWPGRFILQVSGVVFRDCP